MDNEIVKKENDTKKVGILKKMFGYKEEDDFTAERAWIESTYGEGCYTPLEERIASKQNYIKRCISTKFRIVPQTKSASYSSYHCVVDIEDDLISSIDVIFKPFIDRGFKFINLSERVEEIEDEHVYLISWKNVFKEHQSDEEPSETDVKLIED